MMNPLFLKSSRLRFVLVILVILALSFTVFAQNFIYESFISLNPNKIEFIGGFPGGQSGAVVQAGDFNGDGIDDLAIGSPFASSDKKWVGSAGIIFGKSSFNTQTGAIDLLETPLDIVFWGEYPGDQFGSSITSGDYNNDGFGDIAIGAFNAFLGREGIEENRPGKVYVFFGRSHWEDNNNNIDLFIDEPDLMFLGQASGDKFGLSLASLDINNDRLDDILVGAPFASSLGVVNSGVVYGYFGAVRKMSSLFKAIFYGQAVGERFGSVIDGGNLDGDRRTDIVIGAYFARHNDLSQAGKAYLYLGSDLYSHIGLFTPRITEPSDFIGGSRINEWLGFSLDVGKVNRDKIDDVAVGSFPYEGDRSAAQVAVYYGNARNSHEDIFAAPDITVEDPLSEALPGASVVLEDIDGDSKGEIIIGAPGIGGVTSVNPGDVYIVYDDYKGENLRFSIQNQTITSIIHGENPDDWFGYDVEALDFNNDGYEDLAIGSRYSDSSRSSNDGKVFVLLGNNAPYGSQREVLGIEDEFVDRGRFISIIIGAFDLKNIKGDIIGSCYEYREFCFFNFLAMSYYDDIQLEPQIILYPDVLPSNRYYEDITIGTMLGLINGYLGEENSPFHPEMFTTRIQALKVILVAANLVPQKYQFELMDILGSIEAVQSQPSYFPDVDARIAHMWWYPRYVNFAVENSIIDPGDLFRPDDLITAGELEDMIEGTLEVLNP